MEPGHQPPAPADRASLRCPVRLVRCGSRAGGGGMSADPTIGLSVPQAARAQIEGCTWINLTRGMAALIDDADAERVLAVGSWYAHAAGSGHFYFYAAAWTGGTRTLMHRLIV